MMETSFWSVWTLGTVAIGLIYVPATAKSKGLQEFPPTEDTFDDKNYVNDISLNGSFHKTFSLLMPMVKPDRPQMYMYTTMKIRDEPIFITGLSPKALEHTAHHMVLYGCEVPVSIDKAWTSIDFFYLEKACIRGIHYIYGWSLDAPELILPQGVGIRVGEGTTTKYLVLQVHYNHLDKIPPEGDNSGISIHYTRANLPKAGGMIILKTSGFVAPHATAQFETACQMEDEREIHPLFYRVHTHALGVFVSGWRVTPDNNWDLIGERSPKEPQGYYPLKNKTMTFKQNDTLAARCTSVNNGDNFVKTGTAPGEEMCNFFIVYWVEGKERAKQQFCDTPGPPFWSFAHNTNLKNIPLVKSFV